MTWAQQEQRCGNLVLPAKLYLKTHMAAGLQRSGSWLTDGNAILATWVQNLLRWSPEKVFYYRGANMLFKTETLSPPVNTSLNASVHVQDCESVDVYTMGVKGKHQYEYDIFDHSGGIAAQGRYSTAVQGQLLFTDTWGAPLAVARAITFPGSRLASGGINEDVPTASSLWELQFYGITTTNSTITSADQRWIIAAAVQDQALRVAEQNGPPSDWGSVYTVIYLSTLIAAMLFVVAGVRFIFRLVLPAPPKKSSNPFLEATDSQTYGSMASVKRPSRITGQPLHMRYSA